MPKAPTPAQARARTEWGEISAARPSKSASEQTCHAWACQAGQWLFKQRPGALRAVLPVLSNLPDPLWWAVWRATPRQPSNTTPLLALSDRLRQMWEGQRLGPLAKHALGSYTLFQECLEASLLYPNPHSPHVVHHLRQHLSANTPLSVLIAQPWAAACAKRAHEGPWASSPADRHATLSAVWSLFPPAERLREAWRARDHDPLWVAQALPHLHIPPHHEKLAEMVEWCLHTAQWDLFDSCVHLMDPQAATHQMGMVSSQISTVDIPDRAWDTLVGRYDHQHDEDFNQIAILLFHKGTYPLMRLLPKLPTLHDNMVRVLAQSCPYDPMPSDVQKVCALIGAKTRPEALVKHLLSGRHNNHQLSELTDILFAVLPHEHQVALMNEPTAPKTPGIRAFRDHHALTTQVQPSPHTAPTKRM